MATRTRQNYTELPMAPATPQHSIPFSPDGESPQLSIPLSPDGTGEVLESEPVQMSPCHDTPFDCYPKKTKVTQKMERVGFCKGSYILSVECSPTESREHASQWGMSYKYVGPGEGQYNLVENKVFEDDPERCSSLAQVCLAAALLGLFVALFAWLAAVLSTESVPQPGPPPFAEPSLGSTTMPLFAGPPLVWDSTTTASSSTSTSATIAVATSSTTTLLLPGTQSPGPPPGITTPLPLIVSPLTFVKILGRTFHGRPHEAWEQMAGHGDSATFLQFADLAGSLQPPLNATQAWYVFQDFDADADQVLSSDEFTHGLAHESWVALSTMHLLRTTTTLALFEPDLSLRSYVLLLQGSNQTIDHAWTSLADGGTSVAFPRFANYSAALRPPLHMTQAWNVFAKLDVDHDQAVSKKEFRALGEGMP